MIFSFTPPAWGLGGGVRICQRNRFKPQQNVYLSWKRVKTHFSLINYTDFCLSYQILQMKPKIWNHHKVNNFFALRFILITSKVFCFFWGYVILKYSGVSHRADVTDTSFIHVINNGFISHLYSAICRVCARYVNIVQYGTKFKRTKLCLCYHL